jgi:hypothetical protein
VNTAGALGAALTAGLLGLPTWWRVPAVMAVAVIVSLWAKPPRASRLERLLLARWTPAVIAVASAGVMWYQWGSLRQAPLRQDEAAYLFQARLFASGHWADPSPPILGFFEQPHVLVTPALASEYPPGNSLILTPGVLLHAPGLIPVLLLGLSGGLVFALTREVVRGGWGPWAALLAWLGWIGVTGHDTWVRPSYVSELTTSALWLVGWWALLRWRDRRRLAWLSLLALCIGWGVITRPLTTLAYAIPVGAFAMVIVVRRRLWRDLGYASVVVALLLCLIPLWSARTTGNWRSSPLALYRAQYVPWDKPGIGVRSAPPTRQPPPEIACLERLLIEPRRGYTLLEAPADLGVQSSAFLAGVFSDWRGGLIPFVLVAITVMPIELACVAVCCGALLAAYVTYPHDPRDTIYAMEAQAGVIVLAAFGVCAAFALIGQQWLRRNPEETSNEAASRFVGWCVIALVLIALPPTLTSLRVARDQHEAAALPQRRFRALIDALPARRSIVFVRYAADSACGQTLIENHPPLATARAWIVYDRGEEDAQLLRVAPGRVPFVFDASSWQLDAYPGPPRRSRPITLVKPTDAAAADALSGSHEVASRGQRRM